MSTHTDTRHHSPREALKAPSEYEPEGASTHFVVSTKSALQSEGGVDTRRDHECRCATSGLRHCKKGSHEMGARRQSPHTPSTARRVGTSNLTPGHQSASTGDAGPERGQSNFGNKKVVNFRGFGVPTARPEGAKGRTGLGWVWNGHFRPPWGWLLGDFFVP